MVLAEDAAQIAAGKEHRSASALAAYARLLAVVRSGPGYARQGRACAHSARLVFTSFGAAAARTYVADHFSPLKTVSRCAECRFDARLRHPLKIKVVKNATNLKKLKKVHLFRGKCAKIYA